MNKLTYCAIVDTAFLAFLATLMIKLSPWWIILVLFWSFGYKEKDAK